MEIFLTEICPPAWHAPHDRGVSSAVSCAELGAQASHEFSDLIWAWSSGSEEMTGSANAESFEVLRAVRETGLPCYALTNMEAETYPLRLERFAVLGWFDGTVVSGREAIAKPEPAIFTRLLDRFGLTARTTLMIDDSKENLEAAGNLGIQTVLFRSSRLLRAELEAVAVLPDLSGRTSGGAAYPQVQARCWSAPAVPSALGPHLISRRGPYAPIGTTSQSLAPPYTRTLELTLPQRRIEPVTEIVRLWYKDPVDGFSVEVSARFVLLPRLEHSRSFPHQATA